MVKTKAKGSRAERELLHMLAKEGFQVLRAAGSGTFPLPTPDIVAAKKGKLFIFEVKSKKTKTLFITKKQMEELLEWKKESRAKAFVAWKTRGKFFLIEPKHLKKTKKFFSFSNLEKAILFKTFLEKFG